MRTTAIATVVLLLGTVPSMAQSCDELWYQRNLIYKEAGYCFKTAAAIKNFGNAGCKFDDQADVPLSARDRAEVASIKKVERAMGCSQ